MRPKLFGVSERQQEARSQIHAIPALCDPARGGADSRSVRKGVELVNEARCSDLKEKFGPMIEQILKAYLAEAKRRKPKSSGES